MALSVSIKWGKEKFDKVDLDTSEPPEVFQAQVFALTSVPPERQKIMAKGKTLKGDWSGFPVKTGMTLLLMGSADKLPEEPVKKTQFLEDVKEGEAVGVANFSAGLTNMGNTCYMNATIQCLKNVPELQEGLEKYSGSLNFGNIMGNPSEAITVALRDLYRIMNKSQVDSVPPVIFLQVLHSVFPHFAERGEGGVYQQQDANECWTQMVRMLQQRLPAMSSTDSKPDEAASKPTSLVDQCLGLDFKSTMKCDEAAEEPETESTERLYQLSCFISADVKYLHTGLRLRMKETITKHSPSLARDASYTKTSSITRLPSNLAIQFVRFFYKEKEKVNAKILKDIKFPMLLDVYDLCAKELQEKLVPMRDAFKEQEDKDAERKAKAKSKDAMEVDEKERKTKEVPSSFPEDPSSNNSGYYELSAVLTHKGRSSSSGHYVAWVRRKANEWLMYDDDNVTGVTSDDVLKLSGGGDWHSAYVLMYSSRKLVVDVE